MLRWFFVLVFALIAMWFSTLSWQNFSEMRLPRLTEPIAVQLPDISRTETWVVPSDSRWGGGEHYVAHTERPLADIPITARCTAARTHIPHQSRIIFDCGWMENEVLQRVPAVFMLPPSALAADVKNWHFEHAELTLIPQHQTWFELNGENLVEGVLSAFIALLSVVIVWVFWTVAKDEEVRDA